MSFKRPDYATARKEKGFSWYVSNSQDALRAVTGIAIKDFNLKTEACIQAYREGRGKLQEMFGPDIQLPSLSTPAISYGHANCLGAELTFPEGGEVGHSPLYASLDQGIGALKAKVDFKSAGMMPFYLDFLDRMKKAFPGEEVGLGFHLEGPLTTAWEMRGHDFFTDILDQPERAKEYLRLISESILAFHGFVCGVQGKPVVNGKAAGMADDIAAMVPPYLWDEIVLPAWEIYFNGMTTGERTAHVEDLRENQLAYLEQAGLAFWDPSISPKLTPVIAARACRVPFAWRLPGFQVGNMSGAEVQDFVLHAARSNASCVFACIEGVMCTAETAEKIRVFIGAAREAAKERA